MAQLAVKVLRKKQEAHDIASFELVKPDGSALPGFSAGSHIDVQVPGGLTRQYSLCNDAAEQHRYRIAVLRDALSRGGSTGMHDAVKEGDMLLISEPRNHFPLVHARRTLLFAGGIGVTPLLSMAQRLGQVGADFTLHYCTRSPERTAFREEIAAAPYAGRVRFHHDDGDAAQKLQLEQVLAQPDAGTHLYVCGPSSFMDDVIGAAVRLGWPGSRIHLERFGIDALDPGEPFEVTLTARGESFVVDSGVSLLEALEARGHDIPNLCRQGVCGECRVPVAAGDILHRDLFLSDADKQACNAMMSCVSRAAGGRIELSL